MTGSFGMLASTLPVQWLLPVAGWRPLFWGLAALMALSMLVIALGLPDWRRRRSRQGAGQLPRGLAPSLLLADGTDRLLQLRRDDRRADAVGRAVDGARHRLRPAGRRGGLFTINISMLVTFWAWGMVTPWLQRRGLGADRLIGWGMPLSFVALGALILRAAPAPDPRWRCSASAPPSWPWPSRPWAWPSRRRSPAAACRPTTW